MHQSDVPECAAGALAANCVKFKASRGSRRWAGGIFILNTEVLLQNAQKKFYDDRTRVSDDIIMAETPDSRGTHGDAYWGKAKGKIGETGGTQEGKAPERS